MDETVEFDDFGFLLKNGSIEGIGLSSSLSPAIREIEDMLMKDDGDGDGDAVIEGISEILGDFMMDVFVDDDHVPISSSPESGDRGGEVVDCGDLIDLGDLFDQRDLVDKELLDQGELVDQSNSNASSSNHLPDVVLDQDQVVSNNNGDDNVAVCSEHGGDAIIGDDDVDSDDDPIAKKRRRQLRNRDAAVKSRERKKMYVKDLEMKSRYLESECRKLGRLLQCCYAENQVLRLSLHGSNAFGAPLTKQESAVLLLESLLLGSLLWFLGIVCVLPLPSLAQLTLNQGAARLESAGNNRQGSVAPKETGSEPTNSRIPPFPFNSKRCKASRRKIKSTLFSEDHWFVKCDVTMPAIGCSVGSTVAGEVSFW